jgi:allantoin racemase
VRLLLLNPNTSASITALLEAAARPAAAAGTEIVAMTAGRGVPYIASRTEAAVAAVEVLELLAEHHAGFDAAIIAAFADPGLGAARESFPIPVVGLAEAGMLTACMLGAKFGIVTFNRSLEAWYQECVAWHGLGGRCAGVFAAPGGFASIETVAAEKEDGLVALAQEAVAAGADVIVLAGAPLSGLAARVRERVPVPVVDCAVAAVKQAEALVAVGGRKPVAGSFQRPGAKAVTGMATALGRWIARAP